MLGRREFVKGVAATGVAHVVGARGTPAGAEAPPETPTLRVVRRMDGALCIAPQYVAEDLLRLEGFADLRYVETKAGSPFIERALASGEVDISLHYIPTMIGSIDAGDPIVFLAGGHVGCYELFAREGIRTIRELKGRTVAVPLVGPTSVPHLLMAVILKQVGLDPDRDVRWAIHPAAEQVRLLTEGKIDAFLAFPPASLELRDKKVGRVLLNSALDRPWAQYFCCAVVANRDFVRRHPVATKRAVRALLKSADLCALEPERSAQVLVDRRYVDRPDYARSLMRDLPYGKWREYSAEDSVRFYALRLHEAGLIKSNPQRILAQGTDWRFLNELKKELKG
jgi:NitT/TauT family transport system substrate-binding protein